MNEVNENSEVQNPEIQKTPESCDKVEDFDKALENRGNEISQKMDVSTEFNDQADKLAENSNVRDVLNQKKELGDGKEYAEAYKDARFGEHKGMSEEEKAANIAIAKENWEGYQQQSHLYDMALERYGVKKTLAENENFGKGPDEDGDQGDPPPGDDGDGTGDKPTFKPTDSGSPPDSGRNMGGREYTYFQDAPKADDLQNTNEQKRAGAKFDQNQIDIDNKIFEDNEKNDSQEDSDEKKQQETGNLSTQEVKEIKDKLDDQKQNERPFTPPENASEVKETLSISNEQNGDSRFEERYGSGDDSVFKGNDTERYISKNESGEAQSEQKQEDNTKSSLKETLANHSESGIEKTPDKQNEEETQEKRNEVENNIEKEKEKINQSEQEVENAKTPEERATAVEKVAEHKNNAAMLAALRNRLYGR